MIKDTIQEVQMLLLIMAVFLLIIIFKQTKIKTLIILTTMGMQGIKLQQDLLIQIPI